jgi:glycosyltransferase involved in cell wall biosynthesis
MGKSDSKMDSPLVSVITPTLNSERFVADNVKSIIAQTYPNIEHVVVDGGSDDATLSIVRELDPKAVISSGPDKGISDAFNKGLKLAKGDIIAVLNSDDYYAHNDAVQHAVEAFNAHQQTMIVYGKVDCVDRKTGRTLVIYGEPFSLRKMKKEIITPHQALFARKEVYQTVGPFSLDFKVCMDHEYLLRATTRYTPYFLNEVLSVMRWGGTSTRNIYRGHREAYRILRSAGVNTAGAALNLAYRYAMTTLSLSLQRIGLDGLVRSYRRRRGLL